MKPALLIMAAGMGSRYGGLKQLDRFGPSGETLLDYAIYDARRAGFGKVVFVIRPEMEADFHDQVCARFADRIEVHFAHQTLTTQVGTFQVPESRQKPWGTAHAVLSARELISEPFAAINADDYYGPGGFEPMAEYLTASSDPHDWAMVGYTLRHTLSPHGHVSRGVCSIDNEGFLQKVTERYKILPKDNDAVFVDDGSEQPLSGDTLVSMNLWGFQPAIFDFLARDFSRFLAEHGHEEKTEIVLPGVVDEALQAGKVRVKVLPTDEHWFGVTYPSDREGVMASLQQKVEDGIYPADLWGRV